MQLYYYTTLSYEILPSFKINETGNLHTNSFKEEHFMHRLKLYFSW